MKNVLSLVLAEIDGEGGPVCVEKEKDGTPERFMVQ